MKTQKEINNIDKKEFKFSIIVPIYNVEPYLEESIQSIINQSIGFEDNIQLILINDGSTDNSERICKKYKRKYTDNIVYKKQKNVGVSTTRNNGLKVATGKYINFCDPDDYFDLNAFEEVYKYFESVSNEVDFVSIRVKMFEALDKFHVFDYKYNETEVINLKENPDYIQSFANSIFIKNDIAMKHQFNVNLSCDEDTEYICSLLMDNPKYGVIRDAVYNCRKKINKVSITDLDFLKETLNVFEHCYTNITNQCIEKYEEIPNYIQHIMLHSLKERIILSTESESIEEDNTILSSHLDTLISNFEINIILKHKTLNLKQKTFLYNVKNNKTENDIAQFNDYLYKKVLRIYSAEQQKNKIFLKGHFTAPADFNIKKINFLHNNKKINYKIIKEKNVNYYNCKKELNSVKYFFTITYSAKNNASLKCNYNLKDNNHEIVLNITKNINITKKIITLDNFILKSSPYELTTQEIT
ncbi:MAG: glycosyltransferase family A protein [bacterium]